MAASSKNNYNSEAAKKEQIITEFFAKSLHIILESRSPFVSSHNYSGDQILSSPSSSSSASSSARPRDKWFNLALRECPAALENLDLWRQSNLEPMVVDVVVVKKPVEVVSVEENFPSSWNCRQEEFMTEKKSEKIIERWIVQFESLDRSKGSDKMSSKRGGANNSQLLYKKSIILLRSLYLTVRILPAYKLYCDLNSSGQIYTFSLAHRVSSFVEPFTRREEAEMHHFAFTPIETSCGRLCLSVLYRPTLSDTNSEPSTPMSPQFIPDYVGSPTTNPLKRFPSLPRPRLESQGSPSSLPFARRHSWSYDVFRNFAPSASPSPSPTYPNSRAISYNNSQFVSSSGHTPENPQSCNASFGHKNANFDEYMPSPMFSPSPSPSPPTHLTANHSSKVLLNSVTVPVSIPRVRLSKGPSLPSNQVPPLSSSPGCSKMNLFSQPDNARALTKWGDVPTGVTPQKISATGKDDVGNLSGVKLSHRISLSRNFDRLSFRDESYDSGFCPFAFDDIDTPDPCLRPESFDGKENLSDPLSPGGFRIKKSQDAAVGSMVYMLQTAPPLQQDIFNSKVLQVSKPEISSNNNSNSEAVAVQSSASQFGVTSSRLLMLKTTSEALEELQTYRDMKEKLLNRTSEYQALENRPHPAEAVNEAGI